MKYIVTQVETTHIEREITIEADSPELAGEMAEETEDGWTVTYSAADRYIDEVKRVAK